MFLFCLNGCVTSFFLLMSFQRRRDDADLIARDQQSHQSKQMGRKKGSKNKPDHNAGGDQCSNAFAEGKEQEKQRKKEVEERRKANAEARKESERQAADERESTRRALREKKIEQTMNVLHDLSEDDLDSLFCGSYGNDHDDEG